MDDERLICEVRERPCLYNTKTADYKVQLKKENAWKEIAAVLGQNISECMKRWKALRERFARESKKKKKSGDPADNSPPWSYFDQLLFLKEFIKHRRTAGNVDPPNVEESSDPNREGEENETDDLLDSDMVSLDSSSVASQPSTPNTLALPSTKRDKPCKRRRTTSEAIDIEILRQLKGSQEAGGEDNLFGQSIAASLNRLDPQKKSLAKIRIQQVLYEVEFSPPFPPQPHVPPSMTYPPYAADFTSQCENSME